MASDDSISGGSISKMTRRDFGVLAAGSVAALPAQLAAQTPAAGNPGPMLDIAEWSYHWYGVEHALLARGTVVNGAQMYVEHWIPVDVRHPYPVVLIHGGYGQGSDWIGTPDGRRGWATMFLEQGYKVYVIDRPGQGRNPFQPFVNGRFDREAQTFERTAKSVAGPQWPGSGDANDPAVVQLVASLGQPMGNNPVTQNVWRTRGAMLLDDIGPAVLISHRDGAVFAWVTAQARPDLVKGIVAVEPAGLDRLNVPTPKMPVLQIKADATGPMIPMLKNNREALQPVLEWLDMNVTKGAPAVIIPGVDPNRNGESTALKLADQGSFWVGVQRKKMPYGEIAMGQMFVQYMIPAEKRHRYPVVLVHGGGAQGTHMMGIGGRPGWVHYFVQAGYSVYWVDRPSYGRSPYHPDALGPSHLPNVPPYEGLITSTAVFNTAQWPGPGGMNDPLIDQFMACEYGNVGDEAFHSDLVWRGGAELLDRIGPSVLCVHAFGGFFAWGVADRRPNLVKAIMCMEINGNPFAAQLRWGLTAGPMTFDPPVTDISQFRFVEKTEPPDSPRPVVSPYKLQAEPVHKWKNLQGMPVGWLTSEFGGGGSPVTNVAFLNQVGCSAEMLRLRDSGIYGNGNLMLMEKNNHEVFGVIREWFDRKLPDAKV
ncbi:MAG TPA: alpha/beta fold hydrolase [Bryobacteraceae bacterium]|jgi:pimeloyl-ACP methyl ester carboxylesterase|nr:alpha/beta fold hydrolase [Bryobacteraceae bacterium]